MRSKILKQAIHHHDPLTFRLFLVPHLELALSRMTYLHASARNESSIPNLRQMR